MACDVRSGAAATRRLPAVSLLLAAAALAVAAVPGAAGRLEYDRSAVAAGEVWRIVTGHWTHVNTDHLIWDVFTFAVLGALCERANRGAFLACVAGAAAAIPPAIGVLLPGLATYRGLSGIDCALFALLAATGLHEGLAAVRRGWAVASGAALLALLAKIAYETATGGTLFVGCAPAGMAPVPLAHAVGAAAGIAAARIFSRRPWTRDTRPARGSRFEPGRARRLSRIRDGSLEA